MIRDISHISRHKFDILVVGGGINGAAIAYLGAENGLSVALIDKGDFASGTSSKSSKLLHGGIRYLENLEFGLVAESLKERYIQYKNAPHLIQPMPFIIPIYTGDPRSAWMVNAGVSIYEFLSGSKKLGERQKFSAQELLQKEPGLNPEGLKGGVLYYDAQMDDARLCLENILMADLRSAKVANYVEALSLVKENKKTAGVVAKDLLTGQIFEIRAKRVICALGPWTEKLFKEDRKYSKQHVRMTKGVHLVYKDSLSKNAIVIQTKSDRRIFFVIPWMGHTLIGTTDTDYQGSLDRVVCEADDLQYLLNETKRIFPNSHIEQKNVITTFAGLRPLVHAEGHPSKVSRKHEIETVASGVIYVMGGKYTTYRKIAEDSLKKFFYLKARLPLEYPLYGSGTPSQSFSEAVVKFGISEEKVHYLWGKYGARYLDVLEMTREDVSLKNEICECSPAIKAQVKYSIDVEMAQNPDDIINRRLGLVYIPCSSGKCKEYIRKCFQG
ncbi:MAG: glycerol-3-phosphate dehydrogenase/oxidase [Candidatus Omnitrophica bacterium]|nr:glycerol-3-phosphate dehydrogenase/oxidase [Candidatus Omnitrophota bacterium]